MKLSILTTRRDRPDYTWAELYSILLQQWDPRDYEIIIVDESTTTALPEVVKIFRDEMVPALPLRFVHIHGWHRADRIHVGPNDRRSITWHLNYGLRMAQGAVILLLIGEFLHIGRTMREMTDPHQTHPALIYHGCVRDLSRALVDRREWMTRQDTTYLLGQDEGWGQWFVHPQHTPLHDELVFSSVRTSQLRRIGGFDEAFLAGLECELGESQRRLVRAGCAIQYSDCILGAHIEHERAGRDMELSNYRATRVTRRMLDQGYWEHSDKVKYYRPGTEKRHIRANRGVAWGTVPSGVEVWTLEEALRRLPAGETA